MSAFNTFQRHADLSTTSILYIHVIVMIPAVKIFINSYNVFVLDVFLGIPVHYI